VAQGNRCQAPPGRSGVEQYCESLPGPGGPQGGGNERGRGPALSNRAARELRDAGGTGAALIAAAEASGGSSTGADSGGSGSGNGNAGGKAGGANGQDAQGGSSTGDAIAGSGSVEKEPSGSVLTALRSSVEDGPTVSSALPWLLVLIAIGAFGLAFWGRRRPREDDGEPGEPAT